MAGFNRALTFVLGVEGGWSNHPLDKGGATNHGVTQALFDSWRASTGQVKKPVADITSEEVDAVYHSQFWVAGKCDAFPWPLSLAHFDACVNHGPGNAWIIMQKALGVKADGIPGAITMQAVYAMDAEITIWRYLRERMAFYVGIVKAKPNQITFLKGWLNRLFDLHQEMRA